MSSAIDGLNHGQRKAVESLGNTLVVACPGSGKTRVLQNKAQHIVQTHENARVVAVTFTSDSAAELKQRIASCCTPAQQDRILTGTFHSLAKFHLERSGVKVSLMDPANERSIVAQTIKKSRIEIAVDDVIPILSRLKSTPTPHFRSPSEQVLLENYQSYLAQYQVMDFSDLLLKSTVGMIDGNLTPLPTTFMFVDESQDLDELQFQWVQQHANEGVGITLVGDDDQSIYSFRNAMGYVGMDNFLRKNSAVKITLDTNYRCREEILSSAERLILNNNNRLQKSLKAHRGRGGAVSGYIYNKSPDEQDALAQEIARDPTGWAVICRTNTLLDGYEAALTSAGVKVQRVGGKSFWDHRIVTDLLGILKTLGTRDYLGITGFLNRIQTDQYSIDLLVEHNMLFNQPDLELVKQLTSKVDVLKKLIEQFPKWDRQCRNDCIDIALKSIGQFYLNHAFANAAREKKAPLVNIAVERLKNLNGTLRQRLAAIEKSKRNKGKSSEDDEKEDVVKLVTMHSSKGLEFPKVWLPSSGREICPSKKALEESSLNLEEERRLYYVAMTRAQDRLVVSTNQDSEISRFIFEANIQLIESDHRLDADDEAA